MITLPATAAPQEHARRVRAAMLRVIEPFADLAPFVHDTWVEIDASAKTFAMTRDGVLIAPPHLLAQLNDDELDFIVAHELMHRRDRHHVRGEGEFARDFNVATDRVINARIAKQLGRPAPLGVTIDASAYGRSAESVFLALPTGGHAEFLEDVERSSRRPDRRRRQSAPRWGRPSGWTQSFDARSLSEELCVAPELLHEETTDLFGSGGSAFRRGSEVRAKPMDASSIVRILSASSVVDARRRTYARPSRRRPTESNGSLVVAGRRRERGNPWRIVIDVSLSCSMRLGELLGLASDLVRRAGLGAVDVAFTDGVSVDWLRNSTAESLERTWVGEARGDEYHVAQLVCSNCHRPYAFRLSNACFGSLAPVFETMESEGGQGAIVLTDGLIGMPASTSLEEVVFVLERLEHRVFRPPFGRVIEQPESKAEG